MRGRANLAAVLLAGLLLPCAAPVRAADPTPDAAAVDNTWLNRDARITRKLQQWAKHADLADLVWLLRRPPSELGAAGPVLARAAFDRTASSRTDLRARLAAVLGVDPRSGKPLRDGAPATPVPHPGASVFRVGILLPDSGDYREYAESVRRGIEAGLQSIPAGGSRRIDVEFRGTGDDDPARSADALEAAASRDGLLFGELLSVPTRALATGARILSVPLVSPTATDEAIGTIGPGVFQIGPSGWRRGERLARAVIDRPGRRVALLVAVEPERSPFARGFRAVAESLGATVEWASDYRPGTSFRDEAKTLASRRIDVLLWDGEPADGEALVRELSRQKVSLRLCGGEGLDPARFHADARIFLDGTRYVAEDWKLEIHQWGELDKYLRGLAQGPVTALHIRGWIAGRAVARAVAGGALCPEEVRDALQGMCGAPPWLDSHRFLDPARDGATLALFEVARGRSAEVPEAPATSGGQ